MKKQKENSHIRKSRGLKLKDVQAKRSTVKVSSQLHRNEAMQYIDIGEFFVRRRERENRIYFPFD